MLKFYFSKALLLHYMSDWRVKMISPCFYLCVVYSYIYHVDVQKSISLGVSVCTRTAWRQISHLAEFRVITIILERNQYLKGEFPFFFYSRIECPPIRESNLMGPKKSVEVKLFTVAFFGVCPSLLITLGTNLCRSNSIYDQLSLFIISYIFSKPSRGS